MRGGPDAVLVPVAKAPPTSTPEMVLWLPRPPVREAEGVAKAACEVVRLPEAELVSDECVEEEEAKVEDKLDLVLERMEKVAEDVEFTPKECVMLLLLEKTDAV